MNILLALALATSGADRIADLEIAGMEAVLEINAVAQAIESRGRPGDAIIVTRLNAASESLYEVVSDGQFICDDHPERCAESALEPGEQPWFCENYIAVDEPPLPGCLWEGGRYGETK